MDGKDTSKDDEILAKFAEIQTIARAKAKLELGNPHKYAAEEMLKLVKQYGIQERIDENEQWLRHIGPAWNAEGVLATDVNKRNTALKDKENL